MFTGIVQRLCQVADVRRKPGLMSYVIDLSEEASNHLKIGASISVDGVCQTVTSLQGSLAGFDAIQETLDKTTLCHLNEGQWVNIERSACFGEEIGGHILSGHVYGTARIARIENSENNKKFIFDVPRAWMKYFFAKGYIALDGVSLTLVDVDAKGKLSVCLIPETLRVTTFSFKTEGDEVNVEIDAQTQIIVDTVERMLTHL